MGKLEGFNERRSEGSMFSTTFFNKIKQQVSTLKEKFLENEDLRPSQTLDASVQGFKAGLQAIEEADREGLIGDHLTEEQKYAINQIAIQGDNIEPSVDEQGKLTLSVDGEPMTIDEINELGVKAIAPEKERTAITKLAMQARETGKQGEPFRRDEVFGSVKALIDKGDIDALLKNDITGTGTTPLEDISKNHPGFANLSYASLGIDPTGIDLNGDGIINEDERALLSNSDREKIIKADSNILADYVTRKISQSHMGGKNYFDEQNPKKEEEPKKELSADELIKKYGGDIDRYISNIAEEERPGYEGADYPDDEEGYIKTAKEAGFPFKSPLKDTGGSVLDSLRNVATKENQIKYQAEAKDLSAKINSLRNNLTTRAEAGEFKTQAAYDEAYEKQESEIKKMKDDFRKRTSYINIDNQVMPEYKEIYDKDVKRYKKGELTFEQIKKRFPTIHETDLK
jgi:hypothetical protein